MGFKIDKPVFSDAIKKHGRQNNYRQGYIIPVEGYKSHKEFIFRLSLQHVFLLWWCRPETVMEVSAKEAVKYTTEQITLTGTLRLNSDDINRLMFKIDHAVRVDK